MLLARLIKLFIHDLIFFSLDFMCLFLTDGLLIWCLVDYGNRKKWIGDAIGVNSEDFFNCFFL
jgi:hypothetical protein